VNTDGMSLEDPDVFAAATVSISAVSGNKLPTLTLEEATVRIGPEVLQTLAAKFNGSLTGLRLPDAKDQLF